MWKRFHELALDAVATLLLRSASRAPRWTRKIQGSHLIEKRRPLSRNHASTGSRAVRLFWGHLIRQAFFLHFQRKPSSQWGIQIILSSHSNAGFYSCFSFAIKKEHHHQRILSPSHYFPEHISLSIPLIAFFYLLPRLESCEKQVRRSWRIPRLLCTIGWWKVRKPLLLMIPWRDGSAADIGTVSALKLEMATYWHYRWKPSTMDAKMDYFYCLLACDKIKLMFYLVVWTTLKKWTSKVSQCSQVWTKWRNIDTVEPLFTIYYYLRTQLGKNDCTYCKKYLIRDMDIDSHVKWFHWSMTFPNKLQKFVKPLDLHVKFPISTYM